MKVVQFVGDPKHDMVKYRGAFVCSLSSPQSCLVTLEDQEADRLIRDHGNWFKMVDDSEADAPAPSVPLGSTESNDDPDKEVKLLSEVLAMGKTDRAIYGASLGIDVKPSHKSKTISDRIIKFYEDNHPNMI